MVQQEKVELSKSFLEDINVIILSGSVAKKFSEFVEPIALSVAKRESENEQSSNGEAEFRFRESVTHCS
ncbi:hypothetical protein [Salinivibrio socompensis]|uniref:hypothetical protein n=1 Tax=Salinivibrio socompensis TaxID=1510206 RepID=UPI000471C445|nr:hypothetical protein [Salinivibrio socompensis]